MEISRCNDDLCETLEGFLAIALIWILTWFILSGFWLVFVSACILILFLAEGIHDYLYFGRCIVLDENGCTFKLGRWERSYAWSAVNVIYCKNTNFCFGDGESPLPGIIISGKAIKKPKKVAAMTYCRMKHPLCSVFLRFENNVRGPITLKRFYNGYVVNREELLEFLKKTGVSVS